MSKLVISGSVSGWRIRGKRMAQHLDSLWQQKQHSAYKFEHSTGCIYTTNFIAIVCVCVCCRGASYSNSYIYIQCL